MSALEIVTIPCLSDNYAYLLRDASGRVGVIDAPEAEPVVAALEARGWGLDAIWITHHHADHIDGVAALRERYAPEVVGARADRERLPPLDRAVGEGESLAFGDARAAVIDVSGHSLNHVAYHFSEERALFSGDSLFVLGCGRVFEGTHAMMWASLSKLARLAPETRVYCGHEYTLANLAFARSVEPDNPALREQGEAIEAQRARDEPTPPSTIGRELAANPFLRAPEPALQRAIGLEGADPAAVFAEVRRRKDAF